MSVQVKFKQAAHVSGKDYAFNQTVEVTPEMAKDAFFAKLMAAGHVVYVAPAQEVTAESILQAKIDLVNKVNEIAEEKSEEAEIAEELEIAEDVSFDDLAEEDEGKAPAKKKKSKK